MGSSSSSKLLRRTVIGDMLLQAVNFTAADALATQVARASETTVLIYFAWDIRRNDGLNNQTPRCPVRCVIARNKSVLGAKECFQNDRQTDGPLTRQWNLYMGMLAEVAARGVNPLRLGHNGRHIAADIFKCIYWKKKKNSDRNFVDIYCLWSDW